MVQSNYSQAIKANVDKAKNAAQNGLKGYYRDSELSDYSSWVPYPYGSLENVIDECIEDNGHCRILEIGCGEGKVAQSIVQKYQDQVSYATLDVVEPTHKEGVQWIENDIDNFQPEQSYDLIFSINGIIYGHDDQANLIKFANALEDGGRMFFNFDGWTDCLRSDKTSKFHEFLRTNYLDALQDQGLLCYTENKSGRRTFFAERKNEQDLNADVILDHAQKLKQRGRVAYIPRFGDAPVWIDKNEDGEAILTKAVDQAMMELQKKEGLSSIPEGFKTWIQQSYQKWFNLLELNIPVEDLVEKSWKEYAPKRRQK